MTAVRITLLGAPSITRDGEAVVLDTRKALALVAHLALGERPRARELLCDLLWSQHDAVRARGALRRTLSTVRGAVGEERLLSRGDCVALRRDGPGLAIDVDEFRALAGDERDASVEDLQGAAAVFGGRFLEGFALRDSVEFEDWQTAQADLLDRELSSVLGRLVAGLSARGEHERALPHARRRLALDPLHEPAHQDLISLHALTGDRGAAIEQYRQCVRTLTRELGVEPLPQTSQLYERVNDGRLGLAAAAQASSPSASPAATSSHPDRPTPPLKLPFVGRDDELSALRGAHDAARTDGRLAVVEGEAGIGRSRLLEELARTAAGTGATVLSTRCHDDEAGIAYGPIVELLRAALARHGDEERSWSQAVAPQRLADAALLLPELAGLAPSTPAPLPLDGPGARVRLLEAVGAVLAAACAGAEPGIVLLDDVHGADEATIDAISYLSRRLQGRPLLLVVSWRSENVPPGHRLRRLAVDGARDGTATIVRPVRLTRDEVAQLVRAAGPDAGAEDLQRRVHLESEGLPLFVAQYLAAHALAGDTGLEDALPAGVEGFLAARLAGLGAVARQVLGAAAAIGRSFDLETVREASGRGDEELVGALEELLAQNIVHEVAGSALVYDFSHEQLRSLVYEQTSRARRRLLHRRVAAALARGGQTAGERAALVAKHLRLGGEDARAAMQYRVAAEHAAGLHAHADALQHLDAAVALGDPDAAGAHERIGDLRTLAGDFVGALTAYGTAAAHADDARRAEIEHKLGGVHHRRGEWERAQARLTAALDEIGTDRPALRARVLTDLAHTCHQAGRADRATALSGDALTLARASGDDAGEARAHNLLGVLARGAGDLADADAHLTRSLELAEKLSDDPARIAALNNLALVRRDAGEVEPARELTRRALALCGAYGDRHRWAALENNLADIAHAAGDADASMAHLKRAVAIFSEIEADDATRLPEIWKLVSW